jgi:uncharacterized protein (TIGR02594 family)
MTAPRHLHVALDELGTYEIAGDKDHPRIIEYLRTVVLPASVDLHDEVNWCSAFVSWCMLTAGGTSTRNAAARSWLKWGRGTTNPQPGDVAVFWRGSPDSWKGHVGFYIGKVGGYVVVLGGNQGNKVSVRYYKASQLLGCRRAA